MTDNILIDLSIEFAVNIVNWHDSVKGRSILTNQLLRSVTSIGANIHEGNYASSRADFVSKFQIALKECYETEYWLEIFRRTNIMDEAMYSKFKNDSGKIRKILISSINTSKANIDK